MISFSDSRHSIIPIFQYSIQSDCGKNPVAELTSLIESNYWDCRQFCLDNGANRHYQIEMIVYDGIYRLPAGTDQGFQPRAQWEYAWQVRLIDLGLSQSAVLHLKSKIVVVRQTGIKPCLTSGAESIGKKISRDFNLSISRVLWVEHFPHNSGQWCAAVFKLKSKFGPDINYHIRWRPLRPNEVDLIKPFIPEVETDG